MMHRAREFFCRYAWAFFLPCLVLCPPYIFFNLFQSNAGLALALAVVHGGLLIFSKTVQLRPPFLQGLRPSIESSRFRWYRLHEAALLSAVGLSGLMGVFVSAAMLGSVAIMWWLRPLISDRHIDEILMAGCFALSALFMYLSLALLGFGLLTKRHTPWEAILSVIISILLLPFLGIAEVSISPFAPR